MKSIQKGYPFDGPKSKELFPNRLNPELVDGKVSFHIDPEIYPDYYKGTTLQDFLMDRVFDYHKALEIAETQINDMQEEYPFLPEDFNFSPDALPTEDGDTLRQRTFYVNPRGFIMARVEDNSWMISGNGISGLKIEINNSAEAYTVLKSLGIIKDEDFGEEVFRYSEDELRDSFTQEELKEKVGI